MEKIAHIWSVNQFMTQLNCAQSKNLQTFYLRSCKKLSQGCGLPRQLFGPNAMCVHCNSLWRTVDYTIRISSSRPVSKSVNKILKAMNERDKKVPRVQATLGKKALKNRRNKLLIKCSVCSQITKVGLDKPKRVKVKPAPRVEVTKTPKNKKKKGKDKTAGLNIPQTLKPKKEDREVSVQKKPLVSSISTIKFTPKLKKLNINRLKDAVKKSVTPSKSKTLHSFLSEL